MLTEREKQFLRYWEDNRLREKKTYKQLLVGIPIGLIFALSIMMSVFSGSLWYKRADMVANTTNPLVLIVAVILIAVFMAIFYKRHQWEMKEQQYLEIKAKEGDEPGPGSPEPGTSTHDPEGGS
jgi:membrane protein YdbS with pleckstrin-like domain